MLTAVVDIGDTSACSELSNSGELATKKLIFMFLVGHLVSCLSF